MKSSRVYVVTQKGGFWEPVKVKAVTTTLQAAKDIFIRKSVETAARILCNLQSDEFEEYEEYVLKDLIPTSFNAENVKNGEQFIRKWPNLFEIDKDDLSWVKIYVKGIHMPGYRRQNCPTYRIHSTELHK